MIVERLRTVTIYGAIATAPLVWIRLPLANISISIGFTALLILLSAGSAAKIASFLARDKLTTTAIVAFILGAMLALFHSPPAYDFPEIARQISFVLGAFCVGAWILYAKQGDLDRLTWLAPIALLLTVSAMYISANSAGVDLLHTAYQAISQKDPVLLQFGLFKAVFAAATEEAGAHLRHSVFGALLMNALIALLFLSRHRKLQHRCCALAVALIVIFILVSLSRSVILATVLSFGVIVLSTLILRKRSSTNIVFLLTIFSTPIILFLGWDLVEIVAIRVFDSSQSASYEARLGALSQGMDLINRAPLLGGPFLLEHEMHNIVLQHWVGGGLFAGTTAIFLMAVIFRLVGISIAKAIRRNRQAAQMHFSILVLAALPMLPLVRAMTAGSGLGGSEWFLIAATMALIARAHTKDQRGTSTQHLLFHDPRSNSIFTTRRRFPATPRSLRGSGQSSTS